MRVPKVVKSPLLAVPVYTDHQGFQRVRVWRFSPEARPLSLEYLRQYAPEPILADPDWGDGSLGQPSPKDEPTGS